MGETGRRSPGKLETIYADRARGRHHNTRLARQPQSFEKPTKSYPDCTPEAPIREHDECYCSEWNDCSHGHFESVEGYHRVVARCEHIESAAEGLWYKEWYVELYTGSVH